MGWDVGMYQETWGYDKKKISKHGDVLSKTWSSNLFSQLESSI
jgi:hypothetical protein